ncbi:MULTISPECIES: FAD-dependent oxidoreductase [unclassified Bradyrhizobium]|uniref:FAD-dependent oxidoreductase n=1 Tax=unclassified Bradyrhizobium TaxID=2631580 RepID=UPI001FFA4F89|nr:MULTISPECIES: FAD-dependent oxidoreductase [unclassified Bradyrhizobium]MCK1711868.1 FAD-dependent oxidoreductase [Bradyrhizobium sp. 143]MCK1725540.1 FAD-dependent oxidoreductase [Bradyrhizobium sp. 142]
MNEESKPSGPDLTKGVSLTEFKDGKLLGHVGAEDVLLVQASNEIFAIEPSCSHYHGPLAEGLVVDDTIRCPWHHACFSLRTGEPTRPPALNALAVWEVTRDRDRILVQRKREMPAPPAPHRAAPMPEKFVIVGGGAAGFAAAEMLRREGFAGAITMLSDDGAMPADRPNLSKDYLAGNAPEDWLPLRPEDYYADAGIDLRLNTNVSGIDLKARRVTLGNGDMLPFDRLLLATGAEPVKLEIPGGDQPHVHTLRSVADSRAIIKAAGSTKRVLVIGASFIGLEVAASLRARKLEVHVVAPEERPMQRVLGAEMGDFVRALHEENGVNFHLKETVEKIDGMRATLKSGGVIEADLVVVGIGVKPRLALAEQAGLATDRGVSVNEYLESSASGIFAAGDIARWPDPHSGQAIRVEHWVVAERQGQTAARNMLGRQQRFDAVPFFWSQHYDVPINYVGHAESFDDIAIDGSISGRDCLLKFRKGGRVLAVASIYRDLDNLKAELDMERSRA